MAFDGNGTYSPPIPEYPAIAGETIFASDFNAIIGDIAGALSLCLVRDGQAAATANIPMGGFKITDAANGSLPQDLVTFLQVFTNPSFTAIGAVGFVITGTKADLSGTSEVLLPANTKLNGEVAASQAYVTAQAFQTALPAQAGNAGKFVMTDGATASWSTLPVNNFLLQNAGVF